MREGTTFFSSTTRTTTMMAVEILTPVPMTGSWAAGTTFRLAVLLAEGLIKEDTAGLWLVWSPCGPKV